MASIMVEVRGFREGDTYVALCPELDVSSFGDNIESAKESLKEALTAFVEECEARGTLQEVLEEAGFVHERNRWDLEEPGIMEP
jgi:predicted RNase H-like HicB family nuclease